MQFIIENEIKHLYNNKKINSLAKDYKFVEKNEKLILKVKDLIKSKNILDHKNFTNVKDFKYVLTNIFKNDEIFYIYISIFIIESFNRGLVSDTNIEKVGTIHDNINRIETNIQKLNIYILRKNKMSEKRVENLYVYILKLVKLLEEFEVIKRIKLYKNNKKSYDLLEIKDFNISPQIEIYQNEFEVFQFNGDDYLISETFNSIKSINSINPKTEPFRFGVNKAIISKLCNRKINIDLELLKEINKEYCSYNNIELDKVEESYIELLENHSELMKEKDEEAVKKSSEKISLYQKAMIFNHIIDSDINYCYSPIILDFRGRVYKTSAFSITFIKELRLCIHFGEYEENFFNNYVEGESDKILNDFLYMLQEMKDWDKIKEKNIVIKRSIIWCLVDLAQNFKSRMGKEITIDKFIKKGIEVYDSQYLDSDYEIKIKLISTFKIINMLINNKIILKRLISKDATGSVYQQLVKLLNPKTPDYLKKVNLDSKFTWYDIYSFIIEDWKKEQKNKIIEVNLKEIDKYFNRKTLKQTLMTKNYGCGLEKSRRYYFDNFSDLNLEDKKKMGKLFYNFYIHISNNSVATYLDSDEILKYLKESEYDSILLYDDSKVNLKYFKMINSNIDTKLNGKRYTHRLKKRTNDLDWVKMEISSKANYIHMQDGCMARDVATRIACFIIHDCFMAGCLEISTLIDIINICFNCDYDKKWPHKNRKKTFSIFIVL